MLYAAPAVLGVMPKFVLGGLLIYLGADLLHKWIVLSRRRLSLTEYLSLLAIIVIILQWGFIAGILIGVVIGCATFALSASRIDSIKYGFDGSEYRSSLDRSRDDQEVLAAHGGKIQGLNLQSYLFFGSANRLYQHVKALLALHPECRFLVFDFKLVTGIDRRRPTASRRSSAPPMTAASSWCWCTAPRGQRRCAPAGSFPTSQHRAGTGSCAGGLRERDHRAASGPRTGGGRLRDWFTQIFGTSTTPRS